MSKAPTRRAGGKSSVGEREFKRRRELEGQRVRRRSATRARIALARPSTVDVRALIARVPRVAWLCALIALLNGIAWSIITPPFEGRDEPSHFAYVQQLAETGTLPHSTESGAPSEQESLVLRGLHQAEIGFSPGTPSLSSAAEQRTLIEDVNAGRSRIGSGDAGVATTEPPVYYALQTIPYAFGAGNVLTQLQLMRLTGALLAAITVLLAFFFLRELLPAVPRAANAALLCVSLQPLFGFMSGTLNPDNLLYTVTAGVLLCLARAFRRGLSTRLAIAMGALVALGFLTKLNFVGPAFGAFVGIGALAVREARANGRAGLRPPGIAAGVGAAPVLLYMLHNALSGSAVLGSAAGLDALTKDGPIFHAISYVWELYLPRLPGMRHYFAGVSTFKDIWFDRSVGLYGWIDTELPGWVDNVALVVAIVAAMLCLRSLIAHRRALWARLPELLSYCAMLFGVLVMVGLASYMNSVSSGIKGFGDPRYLLPLLPLLAAVLTLAIRGAGQRLAPAVAASLVVLFLAHDMFSQLQVIARYYG